jgi:hypothetical protein
MIELELELTQTQMTQKPVLRVEVGARVRSSQKYVRWCWRSAVCKSLVSMNGDLIENRYVVVVSLSFSGAPPQGLQSTAETIEV